MSLPPPTTARVHSSVVTEHQLTLEHTASGQRGSGAGEDSGVTPSCRQSGSLASLDEYGFPGSVRPAMSAWVASRLIVEHSEAPRTCLW